MAVGKEIKNKIGSVQNTQKITSAMQMVAASKMRRTQDRMQQGKPYSDRIRGVISHLANANPEFTHSFMQARDVKRVGFIVVSSDRGHIFCRCFLRVRCRDLEGQRNLGGLDSQALLFLLLDPVLPRQNRDQFLAF